MKTIKVHDKEFASYISFEEIQNSVGKIAEQINHDLIGKNPLFLIILNGAFMFASDLLKRITLPCEISFVKLSSYSGTKSTATVRELIGLDEELKDRNIVIIEDIIDSGITMRVVKDKLKNLGAADVKITTLFFKPDAFGMNYEIDYIGMKIPNDFIVGYGLDYDGHGRNYSEIYKIIE